MFSYIFVITATTRSLFLLTFNATTPSAIKTMLSTQWKSPKYLIVEETLKTSCLSMSLVRIIILAWPHRMIWWLIDYEFVTQTKYLAGKCWIQHMPSHSNLINKRVFFRDFTFIRVSLKRVPGLCPNTTGFMFTETKFVNQTTTHHGSDVIEWIFVCNMGWYLNWFTE